LFRHNTKNNIQVNYYQERLQKISSVKTSKWHAHVAKHMKQWGGPLVGSSGPFAPPLNPALGLVQLSAHCSSQVYVWSFYAWIFSQ